MSSHDPSALRYLRCPRVLAERGNHSELMSVSYRSHQLRRLEIGRHKMGQLARVTLCSWRRTRVYPSLRWQETPS
jgi:hypothetical protein